jgi:hypothetical protein
MIYNFTLISSKKISQKSNELRYLIVEKVEFILCLLIYLCLYRHLRKYFIQLVNFFTYSYRYIYL